MSEKFVKNILFPYIFAFKYCTLLIYQYVSFFDKKKVVLVKALNCPILVWK